MANTERLGPAEVAYCLWQVGDSDCGKPAVVRVRMRDRTGTASVPVCEQHKAEHNRKAAEQRVKR